MPKAHPFHPPTLYFLQLTLLTAFIRHKLIFSHQCSVGFSLPEQAHICVLAQPASKEAQTCLMAHLRHSCNGVPRRHTQFQFVERHEAKPPWCYHSLPVCWTVCPSAINTEGSVLASAHPDIILGTQLSHCWVPNSSIIGLQSRLFHCEF